MAKAHISPGVSLSRKHDAERAVLLHPTYASELAVSFYNYGCLDSSRDRQSSLSEVGTRGDVGFFLKALEGDSTEQLGWEPLRQGTMLPLDEMKSMSLFFFESKRDLSATWTPSLPLCLLSEGKCQDRARSQTRLPGQEANRYTSVSAPGR